jgi:antitoxin ParD1/3/4
MATMNISLPDKMKDFVESKIESGSYSNASEYVRDLIRKEQERLQAIAEIQALLDEGEASGYVPYDRDEIEARLGIATDRKHAA